LNANGWRKRQEDSDGQSQRERMGRIINVKNIVINEVAQLLMIPSIPGDERLKNHETSVTKLGVANNL